MAALALAPVPEPDSASPLAAAVTGADAALDPLEADADVFLPISGPAIAPGLEDLPPPCQMGSFEVWAPFPAEDAGDLPVELSSSDDNEDDTYAQQRVKRE